MEAFFLLHLVEGFDCFDVGKIALSFGDRHKHFKHIICHFCVTADIVMTEGLPGFPVK